ncbi:hypothetical protein LTR37_003414 [Vermiconidia calcicola]|uniref:Uncharacterized protein n=1 Tax=Vermiconidia calcicola TaxID=1690605 RepID=A0ACC3NT15_9PEZI|nr:hypothetical protein LTR37_003414 [Vermiconidia calcicola]
MERKTAGKAPKSPNKSLVDFGPTCEGCETLYEDLMKGEDVRAWANKRAEEQVTIAQLLEGSNKQLEGPFRLAIRQHANSCLAWQQLHPKGTVEEAASKRHAQQQEPEDQAVQHQAVNATTTSQDVPLQKLGTKSSRRRDRRKAAKQEKDLAREAASTAGQVLSVNTAMAHGNGLAPTKEVGGSASEEGYDRRAVSRLAARLRDEPGAQGEERVSDEHEVLTRFHAKLCNIKRRQMAAFVYVAQEGLTDSSMTFIESLTEAVDAIRGLGSAWEDVVARWGEFQRLSEHIEYADQVFRKSMLALNRSRDSEAADLIHSCFVFTGRDPEGLWAYEYLPRLQAEGTAGATWPAKASKYWETNGTAGLNHETAAVVDREMQPEHHSSVLHNTPNGQRSPTSQVGQSTDPEALWWGRLSAAHRGEEILAVLAEVLDPAEFDVVRMDPRAAAHILSRQQKASAMQAINYRLHYDPRFEAIRFATAPVPVQTTESIQMYATQAVSDLNIAEDDAHHRQSKRRASAEGAGRPSKKSRNDSDTLPGYMADKLSQMSDEEQVEWLVRWNGRTGTQLLQAMEGSNSLQYDDVASNYDASDNHSPLSMSPGQDAVDAADNVSATQTDDNEEYPLTQDNQRGQILGNLNLASGETDSATSLAASWTTSIKRRKAHAAATLAANLMFSAEVDEALERAMADQEPRSDESDQSEHIVYGYVEDGTGGGNEQSGLPSQESFQSLLDSLDSEEPQIPSENTIAPGTVAPAEPQCGVEHSRMNRPRTSPQAQQYEATPASVYAAIPSQWGSQHLSSRFLPSREFSHSFGVRGDIDWRIRKGAEGLIDDVKPLCLAEATPNEHLGYGAIVQPSSFERLTQSQHTVDLSTDRHP